MPTVGSAITNRTNHQLMRLHASRAELSEDRKHVMYVFAFLSSAKSKAPLSPQLPKARKTYRHRATVEFGTAGALGRELDDLSPLLLHGRLCPLQRCGPLEEVVRGLRIRPLVPITASHEGRRLILGGHCFQAVRGSRLEWLARCWVVEQSEAVTAVSGEAKCREAGGI